MVVLPYCYEQFEYDNGFLSEDSSIIFKIIGICQAISIIANLSPRLAPDFPIFASYIC